MKRNTRRDPKKQGRKDGRGSGEITVRVEARIRREAEKTALDHGAATLEEALAGLVEDMAEAWERPGSWEASAVCGWMSSHPWPQESRRRSGEKLEAMLEAEGGAL